MQNIPPEIMEQIKLAAVREHNRKRNTLYNKKYIEKNREKWNAYQRERNKKKKQETNEMKEKLNKIQETLGVIKKPDH